MTKLVVIKIKFRVNNNEWEVVYCKPNSEDLKRSDGSLTLAVADNNTKNIYINSRLNNYMFEKVLCHELCHVFAFEYDYIVPIDVEEIIADFMSLYGKKIIYLLDDIIRILKQVS